jgi:hypothetical protein
MKKLIATLGCAALVVLTSSQLMAQKIKTLSGSAAALKGVSKMNVVFTYDNMSVGKYDNEADYIAKKKADYDKKEPGRGDKWEAAWKGDRKEDFEPMFTQLFEKNCSIGIGNFKDAAYTMTVHTSRTEPGYNIGVGSMYGGRKNAEIDVDITVKETATGKVVVEYKMTGVPGRDATGNDFDTGERIGEAYAKAGKETGKLIKKETN